MVGGEIPPTILSMHKRLPKNIRWEITLKPYHELIIDRNDKILKMITNKQLSDLLKKDGYNLSDEELNSIRTLLVELAIIEHDYFLQSKIQNNAAETNELNKISTTSKIKNAA